MTTRRQVSVLEFCRELFEWDSFNEVCMCACICAYVSVCIFLEKLLAW